MKVELRPNYYELTEQGLTHAAIGDIPGVFVLYQGRSQSKYRAVMLGAHARLQTAVRIAMRTETNTATHFKYQSCTPVDLETLYETCKALYSDVPFL